MVGVGEGKAERWGGHDPGVVGSDRSGAADRDRFGWLPNVDVDRNARGARYRHFADPTADEKTVKARIITMWSTVYGFLALDRTRRFKSFMTQPLTRAEIFETWITAATPF